MASKLTEQNFQEAAKILQCDVAAIRTVAAVESRGSGFDASGRPVILFERHIFHRYTKGRWDGSHPGLSSTTPGGYGAASAQWDRFEMAAQLDRKAAMLSISMGLFQVMGFNFQAAGFPTVEAFFDAMHKSEREQLIAFCRFLKSAGLDDELRDHEWRAFARGYNGPAYRKNQYDTKLAAAYKKFAEEESGDILELDLPPAPQLTTDQPPTPTGQPTFSVAQIKSQIETAKGTAESLGETVTTVSTVAGKARDSVKAFRTFGSMASFGTTVAAIGMWFKDNPILSVLIFVGIFIICAFAWKYLHRQQVIAVERTKHHTSPLP